MNKYYLMAIEWAENMLKQDNLPLSVKIEAGNVTDVRMFLEVNLQRLKESGGAVQSASYEQIRKFKVSCEKTKTLVGEII